MFVINADIRHIYNIYKKFINFIFFKNIEITKIGEKEYLNSVISMQLNGEYVAAYMGSQLQLHSVLIIISIEE